MWLRALKWTTVHHHSSRGCKIVTCQSWKSEKSFAMWVTLMWSGLESWIFFRSPTLIGHNFAAPWAMMMKSGSFESPKSYLLALYLKNCIVPLLTSVRTSWKVSIHYINRALLIFKWKPLYVMLSFLTPHMLAWLKKDRHSTRTIVTSS